MDIKIYGVLLLLCNLGILPADESASKKSSLSSALPESSSSSTSPEPSSSKWCCCCPCLVRMFYHHRSQRSGGAEDPKTPYDNRIDALLTARGLQAAAQKTTQTSRCCWPRRRKRSGSLSVTRTIVPIVELTEWNSGGTARRPEYDSDSDSSSHRDTSGEGASRSIPTASSSLPSDV